MNKRILAVFGAAMCSLISIVTSARAQGTAFTYQGLLVRGGASASGGYDLTFALFSSSTNGSQIGSSLTNLDVAVTNGLFTVTLDFGPIFTGNPAWLSIGVRTNGIGTFTALYPLQQLTPTPYAIYTLSAGTAASANAVAGSNIVGSIAVSQLPAGVVTNGANIAGVFSGNGAGLTGLQPSALSPVTNGVVVGWGLNDDGETNIPAGLDNVTVVAAGLFFGLALKGDGTVVGWGQDGNGQTDVPAGLTNVMAITGGYHHSLALKRDGTIVGWGDDGYGEIDIPAGLTNATAIAAGDNFSLALKKNGTVVGWGNNDFGKTNIPAGLANVMAIVSGFDFSMALKSNGIVVAWGFNGEGETNVPAGLTNVIAIAAGIRHCVALKSDGSVVGWGDNGYGELNFPPGLSNVTAIAAGGSFSLVLKSDGTLMGFGDDFDGAFDAPAGLANVKAVAAGNEFTYAITQRLSSVVINNQTGVNLSGLFSGDGSGLTNLNASHLATGIIPLPQLPRTVAFLDSNQTFTGQNNFLGNVGIGITNPAYPLQISGSCAATTFVTTSDRQAKENFRPVSPQEVLAKVAALPVSRWNYKEDKTSDHIGPMAQDFHAAFSVGPDDKHIATVDEEGVALVAIKGLSLKLEEKDARISELEKRVKELEEVMRSLAERKEEVH